MNAAVGSCALLAANHLPRRWQGRARFVVLDTDTDFDLGARARLAGTMRASGTR